MWIYKMSTKNYVTGIDNPTSEVKLKKYYLVIGTEANAQYAYQNAKITFTKKIAKHQYLTGPNLDWGHAFFYVVENDEVYSFFSFGPSAEKKIGETKIIGTASTCQYWISEVAQLYMLNISSDQAKRIKLEVDKMYNKSNNSFYNYEKKEWERKESNDKKYRALTNETCAKEAYKILEKGCGEKIPNASGYVKLYGISKKAICPFAWNEKLENSSLKHFTYPEFPKINKAKELLAAFKDEKNEIEYTYYLRTEDSNTRITNDDNVMFPNFDKTITSDWMLTEGDEDPLKTYKYFEN